MASNSSRMSRRRVLKSAGIAAVAGGTTSVPGSLIAAQGGAPAVLTNTEAGRRFRASPEFTTAVPPWLKSRRQASPATRFCSASRRPKPATPASIRF